MITILTGAGGFLGWHIRSAAVAHGGIDCRALTLGARFELDTAIRAAEGSDRFVHVAGVNRADDRELVEMNVTLAEQAALVLRSCAAPPSVVAYASSTQAGNRTPYGEGKERAGRILQAAAEAIGARFVDVRLPNLFGEYGRPGYNSVVATFSALIARGIEPTVHQDRKLTLLPAQDAADLMLGLVPTTAIADLVSHRRVSQLLGRLTEFGRHYGSGRIPALDGDFEHDLFNAFRSVAVEGIPAFRLASAADHRGAFTELVRAAGSPGQTSFSTTAPGVTRGEHFHRRKVERFVVVGGSARISMRRLFTDEVLSIDVTGDEPIAVDMPTLWSHSIRNTGTTPLSTVFWCADTFDPDNPDTYPEPL